MLPNALADALRDQVGRVRRMHVRDRASGRGGVSLPDALARKAPSAVLDTRWQWVFPATRFYRDPVSKRFVRHHLHRTAVQRAVADAAKRAGIDKRVGCHTLRHCFATHLLEGGYDIRTIQELMGHRDIRSTMIYCHALNRGGRGVRSPLDSLSGDPRQPTNLRSTGSSDLTRGRLIEGVHVSTKWRGDLRR
jgi:integrase